MREGKQFNFNEIGTKKFKSQFYEETLEVYALICMVWRKWSFEYNEQEKVCLAHAEFLLPLQREVQERCTLYWLCDKKRIGYQDLHRFKEKKYYKLLVRKSRRCCYEFLLENVVDAKINTASDHFYEKICDYYHSEYEDDSKELLIYITDDVRKHRNSYFNTMREHSYSFTTYEDTATEHIMTKRGSLTIPMDDKKFQKNKTIQLEKDKVYRILARKEREYEIDFPVKSYLFETLLESNVQDDRLKKELEEDLEPVTLSIDSLGEFERKEYGGRFFFEGNMEWEGSQESIIIELCSDVDNKKTADKTIGILKTILADQRQWNQTIFDAVTAHITDDDGKVYTVESGEEAIPEEEFKRRLSVDTFRIENDGWIEVMIAMDFMFKDHCYYVTIDPNGKINPQGVV